MVNIIQISQLIFINGATGPENIVIGIVGIIILIAILAIRDSGITSKKGRNQNKLQKNINQLNEKSIELDNLHQQGILNKKEYINKSIELEKNRIDLIVEQKLNENEKYQKILNAFKNGLITEVERDDKINSIKMKIRSKA